jgi:hypothetical protein
MKTLQVLRQVFLKSLICGDFTQEIYYIYKTVLYIVDVHRALTLENFWQGVAAPAIPAHPQ